jgi:hypothetical protein
MTLSTPEPQTFDARSKTKQATDRDAASELRREPVAGLLSREAAVCASALNAVSTAAAGGNSAGRSRGVITRRASRSDFAAGRSFTFFVRDAAQGPKVDARVRSHASRSCRIVFARQAEHPQPRSLLALVRKGGVACAHQSCGTVRIPRGPPVCSWSHSDDSTDAKTSE